MTSPRGRLLLRIAALSLACCVLGASGAGHAQRLLTFRFRPTARAQLVLWVEREDGTFMGTLRLTEAVARRGIGNRPGALQMNSGFRWPYGRREGVLPVWAHRRAAAPGAEQFQRVIFQDRISEGYASRTSNDQSRDEYFCLSFNTASTTREALDAVTCASANAFNSDKGRYVTASDVAAGYAEPFVVGPVEEMRPLDTVSLYPPRRDVEGMGGADHPDVRGFRQDALAVMPELDAIAMATPADGVAQMIQFAVPADWPPGAYVAYLEVNVEGDYNTHYDDETYPTPLSEYWDYWAQAYGYPYRGQPSVVFAVPFSMDASGMYDTDTPAGYGALHGEDGTLRMMDGSITDDPTGAPGSGADRLLAQGGDRFSVEVVATNVCDQPIPPPECGMGCTRPFDCPTGFVCGSQGLCVGMCDQPLTPPAVLGLRAAPNADVKQSHHWADVHFTPPAFDREIVTYHVRVSSTPIVDQATFNAGVPARRAALADEALDICEGGCPAAGTEAGYGLGHLLPQSTTYIAVQAESCGRRGDIATTSVTTTAITFTTVSPCFIATAAYGSPLAAEVGTFRRFRDRHLMTNALGRALVDGYYEFGPEAARSLEEHPWLRDVARAILTPLAALLHDDAP